MHAFSKIVLAAFGAAALFAAPAGAASLTFDPTEPGFVGNIAATSTTGTVLEGVIGATDDATRRSPWSDESLSYTAILGGSSATYDLGSDQTAISLFWGTIDDYNFISFYNDDVFVETVGGADLVALFLLDEGESGGVVGISGMGVFDKLIMFSGTNSLEFGNLQVSVVPLPAALPLYGAGVALIGLMGWRRRRKAAAV